jgi:UrcA family protein
VLDGRMSPMSESALRCWRLASNAAHDFYADCKFKRLSLASNVYCPVRPHVHDKTCILRALGRVRPELARVFSLAIYRGDLWISQGAPLALACLFAVSSVTAGEPDAQLRTEDIKFQDLNVTTTAGIKTLYDRIHSAALRVCAVSGQPKLGDASASTNCTKKAETRAIGELNLPALTAFAANR